MRPTTMFLTADQARRALDTWKLSHPLPRAGQKLLIGFPPAPVYCYPYAEVERAVERSTYGKTLWKLTFYPTRPEAAQPAVMVKGDR